VYLDLVRWILKTFVFLSFDLFLFVLRKPKPYQKGVLVEVMRLFYLYYGYTFTFINLALVIPML
jgi:hypothetical protein